MAVLTADRLKQLLEYDPETGVFCWRQRRSPNALAGGIAGSINPANHCSGGGYRSIGVDGRDYLAHRLAWLYVYGEMPAGHIDHVNGLRDDNRLCNLRLASRSENLANRGKPASNTSGFKGVSFHKAAKRWVACIQRANQYKYLGLFDTAEDAHKAYCRAASEMFGEFARH